MNQVKDESHCCSNTQDTCCCSSCCCRDSEGSCTPEGEKTKENSTCRDCCQELTSDCCQNSKSNCC